MKNVMRLTFTTLLLVLVALSACDAEEDTSSPLPISSPLLPGKSPLESPAPVDNSPKGESENIKAVEQLREMARADLSDELGIDPADIQLVEVESVEWPNTSLGCPQPGMMYAQVLTPGYRLTLQVNDQQYVYHTDGGQLVVRCEEEK